MRVIEPTEGLILKTLSMYQVKSLHSFDEIIMAAVLTRAEELVQCAGPEVTRRWARLAPRGFFTVRTALDAL